MVSSLLPMNTMTTEDETLAIDLPTQPDWTAEAHPSARLVYQECTAARDRLLVQLDSLDTKASFTGAGAIVLAGGLMTALATKPLSNAHLQDLAGVAVCLAVVSLAFAIFTWWPRTIDVPPHPRALREGYWNAVEEEALRAVADQVVVTFEVNEKVAGSKVFGIKMALVALLLSGALGAVVIFVQTISAGGSH